MSLACMGLVSGGGLDKGGGGGVDEGLRQAFERATYALQNSGHGTWRGQNRAQRLTLEFNSQEARLSHPDGSVSFHLTGYGYGDRLRTPARATLNGTDNRVEYQRGDLTEWYLNGSEGLEQGFTLVRRPGTDRESGPLVIALEVTGGLRPVQHAASVLLASDKGAVLRYAGLRALDARGRILPSRLEVRGAEIRLIVEDRDAQYPLTVDPTWTQQQELTASDGEANDTFGWSAAVDGDTAVIGAAYKNSHQGAAYVFVRSAGVWTQQQELTASDGGSFNYFGISASVSGDTAVIGATGKGSLQGAAYVFVRSAGVWTQQQELTATDGAGGDDFGSSLSVSGDTAVIGAYGKNSQKGAAYVFVRSGAAWSQQQKLTASDGAAGDWFGWSVSVSADTAMIGAYGKNSFQGAAYAFARNGGVWSQQQEMTPSDLPGVTSIGAALSVSGDTAVVGGNGAYAFVRPRLGANSLLVGSAGGTSSVVLSYDGAWTATSNSSFLHIASGSASGTASGLVVFTYDAFTGAGSRTGTLTIAGLTVTVTQAGTNYVAAGAVITVVSSLPMFPWGVAVDGSGNLYFADGNHNAIKEWSAATQQVATLVSSGLSSPWGAAVDGSGNVYIADVSAIREWSAATQQVTTLVSSGLGFADEVAVDSFGNVYISDSGKNAIEEWSAATKQVTTLVSSGLSDPWGVAVDASGNVYIADMGNLAIREWSAATQQVTTLVSSGLPHPNEVAVDGSGNVYISDGDNGTIKEWSPATQQVTTLVPSGQVLPFGMAVDGSGNVYIADAGSDSIKEAPYAFVGPASLSESALAGSDSLLPVLPSTTNLTGIFAPASDQSWLTIGTVANGVVSFGFTANTSTTPRTAHITVLGQQIAVTQNGTLGGPVSLAMGTGYAAAGQAVQVPISLASTGAPTVAAFQADLSFDQTKLTFTSASAGAQLASASKTLVTNTRGNGNVRLLAEGLNQTPISNGVVANVTFTLSPQFTWGASTTVTLLNCASSDALANALSTSCTAGTVTVFTCDLNGDGLVNVADVQIIINEALGVIPAVHDLNHDGVVNVVDVQKEINAALGLGCPY